MMRMLKDYMADDHDRLHGIFKSFVVMKHKDIHKANELLHVFKVGLKRRIVWEEEILFSLYKDRMENKNGDPTSDMCAEHQRIMVILEAIHDKIIHNNTTTDDLEKELIDTLSTHIEKEASNFYSSLDNFLNVKERTETYMKMKRMPQEKYNNQCCK
jgi:iron-sulfur cluster repair protein YtfE (RIC family)